jgi:hypothetical protein
MRTLHARLPVLLGLLLALGACKSSGTSTPSSTPPIRAQISNEIVATAKVTAIEASTRTITLGREDGRQFRIQAGEDVRNFDQIAVGDTLRVKYQETLVATLLAPDESGAKPGVALAAVRAEPGAKPAGGVGLAASVCATIHSIDREAEVVYFSLPSGERFARHVVTKEGREFVKGLRPGDNVQLDYTEVLALSIEKL